MNELTIRKKVLFVGVFCIGILGFLVLQVWICGLIPIDSDKANHLYQAQDIVKGNFFLADWRCSGVTFLFTDLIFYAISYVICGISKNALVLSAGLMNATWLLFVSAVTLQGTFAGTISKKKTIGKVILCFLLFSVQSISYMWFLRVHTGAICYALVIILLVRVILDNQINNRWVYFGYFLLVCLGCFSDLVVLLVGVLPVIIVCIITDNISHIKMKLFGISVAGILASQVVDKLYFWVGAADKNAYLGEMGIISIDQIGKKTIQYLECILNLSNSNFFGRTLTNVSNVFCLANLFFLIVGIIMVVAILIRYFKGLEDDKISICLSWGIVINSLVYIFTNLDKPRYITFVPAALGVLVIRNFENICRALAVNKIAIFLIMYLCAILSWTGNIVEKHKLYNESYNIEDTYAYQQDGKTERDGLAKVLIENGLKSGYATFWDASSTSVIACDQVHVRQVEIKDGYFQSYRIFGKDTWYEEDANFVITNAGFPKDQVEEILGEPMSEIEYEEYSILVYDCDISKNVYTGILYREERDLEPLLGTKLTYKDSCSIYVLDYGKMISEELYSKEQINIKRIRFTTITWNKEFKDNQFLFITIYDSDTGNIICNIETKINYLKDNTIHEVLLDKELSLQKNHWYRIQFSTNTQNGEETMALLMTEKSSNIGKCYMNDVLSKDHLCVEVDSFKH